jgi:RHS repeat-associated protein
MDRVTSYTYDDSGGHLLLTVTDPNGQTGGPDAGDHLTNTYNDDGQVLTQTDPEGLETTFSYVGDNFSPGGGSTTITDPHGNVEIENYINGELISDTKGYGTSNAQTWTFSYDPSTLGGTSETDPNGNTMTSTYDQFGNLLTSTDALGNTTSYTYNSLNESLTVTEPSGIESTYTYDDDGNVLTKTVTGSGDSPSRETHYYYDDGHVGDLTSVVDPDGDTTSYTYDSDGDVATTTTDPGSSTISYVESGATDTDDGSVDSGASADILSSNATTGDSLVALIYTFSGNDDDVTGVTGMGGSWHRAATTTNNNASDDSGVIEVWYALDVAGGSRSLTVNGASGDWQAWVAEFSGVDPVNGFVAATSNYGSSTSPSVTLDGSDGDVAVVGSNVVGQFSASPASPWSEGDSSDDFTNTFGRTAAYRVLSSTGSVSADWTATSSADWGAVGLILAPTYSAQSGIQYVTDGSTQSEESGYASGQTVPILPENSIPGDAVVAVIYTFNGNADDVDSITGLGGDWQRAASETNDGTSDNGGDIEVWYALDISGGSNTITVNGATGGWTGWVGEYSGVDPVNGFVSGYANSGNSDDPSVSMSVSSGDLAVAGANAYADFAASPYTPWVEGDMADDFADLEGDTAAYDLATSTGTVTPTWSTDGGAEWAVAGIVLAPSSGPRGGADTTQDVYDVLGRKVCEASPEATSAGVYCPDSDTYVPGTATWAYDADSEVTSETDPDGNSTSIDYDADGNQTEETDGLGNVTKTAYDADDRVTSSTQGYGTGSASEMSYAYDITPGDCPTDPTGTTYCTQTTNGLSETTTSYYNSLDQLIEQDPPNTTDETATTYTYDPAGNPETKIDGSGTTTYGYDADNRVTGITYSDTPSGMTEPHAVTYSYDVDGNRTQMTDGTGTTTYSYDSLDELTSVEDGAGKTVTYDAAAEITSSAPNGGSATDDSYNSDGQLCWTASTSGSCGSAPSGATSYSYDVAGNRLSSTPSGGDPTTYAYDQAGNLVCETASNESSYDCASPNSSVTSSYEYNGDGLRMAATPANASSEQFTWNVAGSNPELLEDGSNYYIFGPSVGSAPIEQITESGPTPSYLVSDTTGVREQLDSSGSVTGSMSYSSYGVQCDTCSMATPFGFEGGYTDQTGLEYLIHRYYDPGTGQFLSVDPDVAETQSAYGYTGDNPVNGTDPLGLCWPSWACGAEHAIGGGVTTVARAGVDVVAIVPYATYYAAYEAGKGINAVGSHLGPAGSVVSHVVAAPLAIPEAVGLGGDVAIDAFKGWAFGGESIYDEGITGYINPLHGFLPGFLKGPQVYLPGLYKDGCGNVHVNFEW